MEILFIVINGSHIYLKVKIKKIHKFNNLIIQQQYNNEAVNMEKHFFDQYLLLNFATGITAYFWGVLNFKFFVCAIVLFELFQNSSLGIRLINKYIPFWPRAKPEPESIVNVCGDIFFSILGWKVAELLDEFYSEKH
mgnify:CR=1 FL=1